MLRRALKQLRGGKIPTPAACDPLLNALLDGLRRLLGPTEERRLAARALFEQEQRSISERLRVWAGSEAFREAVAWQNRQAVATMLDDLRERPFGAIDHSTRRKESLVARYLQRYCTKNDTIGFFGPVGWGTLRAGRAVDLRLGPRLLATRTVYFEHWAIATLARELGRAPALRPWLHPRRHPAVRLVGPNLHYPVEQTAELPEATAHLLESCDGTRSARAIASALLEHGRRWFRDDRDVYALLMDLADQGVILWDLELPTLPPHPERALRELLEAVPAAVREPALTALAELEHARDTVARAAGRSEAVYAALGHLEDTFQHLTGQEAVRHSGRAYAGRTLVYEDCRRDVRLHLGVELLGPIGPALALMLASARWYTYALATRYRVRASVIYRQLRGSEGRTVEFPRFAEQLAPDFREPGSGLPPLAAEVYADFLARWAELLQLPQSDHLVQLHVADLTRRAQQLFAAPQPGWPRARHHSPDLLLSARSIEAIQRGDYSVVLGELHLSANTLLSPPLLHQHPRPERLIQAQERDLPEAGIAPVSPGALGGLRAELTSLARHDLHLETDTTPSWRPRSQIVGVGELVVDEVDDALIVRTRDGRLAFDVIAFFECFLISNLGPFTVVPPATHTPRVYLDGLIVSREQWHFGADSLPLHRADDPFDEFVRVRRWMRDTGLPRQVFVKTPLEPKPMFVDFDSPLLVGELLRLARQAHHVSLSEVLPALDELWLHDATGNRYTSELRLAMVDPLPWRAPRPAEGPPSSVPGKV
jgi:hypothetical protein